VSFKLAPMPFTIPPRLAPSVAWGLTTLRPSIRLVGRTGLPASEELEAFLLALYAVAPDAPTACDEWSAHELVAHLAAGSEEMARLIDARLAGGPAVDVGTTRPFDEREAPYRAMADGALRRRFVLEGMHLTDSILRLGAMGSEVTVTFTGWDMTAAELVRHGKSELSLHRWDLVGNDDVGADLLGRPELLAHGRKVLAQMGLGAATSRAELHEESGPGALLALWGRDPGWLPPETRCRRGGGPPAQSSALASVVGRRWPARTPGEDSR
jgi:Mycothiol maleylpyruvate isomerase N-terminal domain